MAAVTMYESEIPLIGRSNYNSNRDNINSQYTGADYTTKQGVVQFKVNKNVPLFNVTSEEELDTRVLWKLYLLSPSAGREA